MENWSTHWENPCTCKVSWSSLSTVLAPKNVVSVSSINSWLLRLLLVPKEKIVVGQRRTSLAQGGSHVVREQPQPGVSLRDLKETSWAWVELQDEGWRRSGRERGGMRWIVSFIKMYFCNSKLKIGTPTSCWLIHLDDISLLVGAFPFSTSPWQQTTSSRYHPGLPCLAHSWLLPWRRTHWYNLDSLELCSLERECWLWEYGWDHDRKWGEEGSKMCCGEGKRQNPARGRWGGGRRGRRIDKHPSWFWLAGPNNLTCVCPMSSTGQEIEIPQVLSCAFVGSYTPNPSTVPDTE